MKLALYDFFIAPFQYGFMQQALWVGIVVAITCALLSCFMVLKGWALMSDAVSHAFLPGVVFASYFQLPLIVGAFFAGILCVFTTRWLEKSTPLKSDTVLGIVFSSMFALGVLLYTKIESEQHLMHILFGNLLGIEALQRYQVYGLACVVSVVLMVKRRDLMLVVFDATHAKVAGLSVRGLHGLLLILLAFTAIVALQAVGAVLVISMLIAPGVGAQLVCRQFDYLLLVAVVSSVTATIIGILLSFHANASISACIVLMQSLTFLLLFIYRKTYQYYHQLFWRKERK
ncbi:metal ABC transporter permease [Rappaport israeli]|uniref:metal ABC transporter permease n=1 Tax=Rappaport israeli TaxID=1839807 RepID=UPI00093002B3|nr:metal ABC transporter permease [Rappaport israeli]